MPYSNKVPHRRENTAIGEAVDEGTQPAVEPKQKPFHMCHWCRVTDGNMRERVDLEIHGAVVNLRRR